MVIARQITPNVTLLLLLESMNWRDKKKTRKAITGDSKGGGTLDHNAIDLSYNPYNPDKILGGPLMFNNGDLKNPMFQFF